jgi:hypothetical protein
MFFFYPFFLLTRHPHMNLAKILYVISTLWIDIVGKEKKKYYNWESVWRRKVKVEANG